ncbi:DUF2490 domain-containing protein [Psychroflexus salis]|uniref:DUF2490 domain-containing protein n=1 Tax=Psychroflexus salis TaxID=1526574 RepID=A0A917ECJ0_9FLAO|nr:DUF2490 domain-containing protein [Psychroflexus salis]GGE19422.1 hypothetical protein GCM10010831_20680 [Psychroflexus salis]
MQPIKALYFILFVCCLYNTTGNAQNTRQSIGFFPEASLSYKLNNGYSITHKIESQHGVFDKTSQLNEELAYKHVLTDLQSFIGKKISPFVKIDLGYQYRLEKGENTHRTIQQVSILQRESRFRLGHRIRIDQTFFKEAKTLWRARYRAKIQIPLQGFELDAGEKYISLSNELIYMYQDREDDLENRLAASLGFYINDKNKLEIGFDYRTDDYLVEDRFRHRLWFKIGYYKSI